MGQNGSPVYSSIQTVKGGLNSLCVIGNIILATWLVVLTIVLILCHINILSSIDKLEDTLEDYEEIVDGFSTCCADLPTECPCTNISGLEVLCWDANTNTPMLISGMPPLETVLYVVCTPGNTLLDGVSDWELGDYVRFVEEEFAWLQNKARGGTGIVVDTFALNWTCSLWANSVEGNVSIIELDENWYLATVQGVVETATSTGQCIITSSPMPPQYQFNGTFPEYDARESWGISVGNSGGMPILREKGVLITLDNIWTVYGGAFIGQFFIEFTGFPLGFRSFDRVFSTDPEQQTPFVPT